jgi:hypothetical protein
MSLPTEAAERKAIPIATGFMDYFPDAIAEIAELSRIANEQHNPGQPVHWDKSKSKDEDDAAMRHFLQRFQGRDTDGVRHRTKFAWRAMAGLQRAIDAEKAEQVEKHPNPIHSLQQIADRYKTQVGKYEDMQTHEAMRNLRQSSHGLRHPIDVLRGKASLLDDDMGRS